MKLLIDENLSPRLALWANERGGEASAAVYAGLHGAPDAEIWHYAYAHGQIVVTVNVGDCIALAGHAGLHPDVIAFREAGLSRQAQWELLEQAMDHIRGECAGDLTNQVLEVRGNGQFLLHAIPPC